MRYLEKDKVLYEVAWGDSYWSIAHNLDEAIASVKALLVRHPDVVFHIIERRITEREIDLDGNFVE